MNSAEKRNILILTPQLPWPAHQGTTLRNFHIIKGLAANNTITLLSYTESDPGDFGPLADLCYEIATVPVPERSTGTRLWQLLSTRRPDMAHRLHSLSFELLLDDLLRDTQFDIVQIEGIELARTIEVIRDAQPSAKIVFDNHNAETELQRVAMQTDLNNPKRWVAAAYSWVQVQRLARFEAWACAQSDAVTVVSKNDELILKKMVSAEKPLVSIPNCIDTEQYQQWDGDTESADIVFLGKMDYRPNIDAVLWFTDEIWPLVRANHPDATFAIVGQKPHARLERLRTVPGVTITGWVESVLPWLLGAQVVAMPLRMGSGTRLKLIEALSAGRPVVSTTMGVAGFEVRDGVEVLIGDNSAEFAEKIGRILTDTELASALTEKGLEFAKKYDWRQVIPAFDELYTSLT